MPDRDREILIKLLELDADEAKQLSEEINQSTGTFAGISSLLDKHDLDGAVAVGALMSLMVVGRRYRIDEATLVDSLRSSFSAEAVGEGIRHLLTNTKLRRFAKAYALRNEYERILTDSRILSDIRPVFEDVEDVQSIDAATVNHTIRLSYTAGDGEQHESHFALDADDLRKLKAQVERALAKDAAAQELLKRAGVDVLGPIEDKKTHESEQKEMSAESPGGTADE